MSNDPVTLPVQGSRTEAFLKSAIDSARRHLDSIIVYLSSVTVLVGAFVAIQGKVEAAFPGRTWLALLIAMFPLLVAFLFHTIPEQLDARRDRVLNEEGLQFTSPPEPEYFRTQPLGVKDRAKFPRPDNLHVTVAEWLTQTEEQVLFLTGRSGTGKTSLLSAYVVPALEDEHSFAVCTIRTYDSPLDELTTELIRSFGLEPPPEPGNLAGLVRQAIESVKPNRLLIILDQFENLLIMPQEGQSFSGSVNALLQAVLPHGESVRLLFVLRAEYLDRIPSLGLPLLRQGDNWQAVTAFDLHAAERFLKGGLGDIPEGLLRQTFRQIFEIEEVHGRARPIVLNMMGLALARSAWSERTLSPYRSQGLLIGYVRDAIREQPNREQAARVLGNMLRGRPAEGCAAATPGEVSTAPGTASSVDELARASKLLPGIVVACLTHLVRPGLVRLVRGAGTDVKETVWEIAHDFLVPIMHVVLGTWRKSLWRRMRPWMVPSGIGLLIVFVVLFRGYLSGVIEKNSIANIIRSDIYCEVRTLEDGTSLRVTFDGRHAPHVPSPGEQPLSFTDALGELRNVGRMTELEILNAKVTLAQAKHLTGLKHLKSLSLEGSEVQDESLALLTGLKRLNTLNLSRTRVSDEGIAELPVLRELKTLWLEGNVEITDRGVEELTRFDNLKILDLEGTGITDKASEYLLKLQRIEALYVGKTRIADRGVAALKSLRNLRRLYLRETNVREETMTELVGQLPKLAIHRPNTSWLYGPEADHPATSVIP